MEQCSLMELLTVSFKWGARNDDTKFKKEAEEVTLPFLYHMQNCKKYYSSTHVANEVMLRVGLIGCLTLYLVKRRSSNARKVLIWCSLKSKWCQFNLIKSCCKEHTIQMFLLFDHGDTEVKKVMRKIIWFY